MPQTYNSITAVNYISEKEIAKVIKIYFKENAVFENYSIDFASQNMLGFLCDYLRLNINVSVGANEKRVLNCFIKSISKSNKAKAEMVKELKLYEKESKFYTIIIEKLRTPGIKAWSAKLIVALEDALVFEDLNSLGYRMHYKLKTLDDAHIFQALRTLARFHASSIIYEEQKSVELNRPYRIYEDYKDYFDKGGYKITAPWFSQCMIAALEVVKSHSKYAKTKDIIDKCDRKWANVWKAALDLTDTSSKYRNVICHRDLWNNNLMFHYKGNEPDDCLLVDFQAARYHPPAGDVVLLLFCNLEASYREENFNRCLKYYHCTLQHILEQHCIEINDIISLKMLQESAKDFRLWGLVATACLVPQFWMKDDLTTKIFTDSNQFNKILSQDKATFIRKMCDENVEYRIKVLDLFEEIVCEYILN
ncbi:unnamed protein product [Pieris macdunnoughi]|uniref:CHK kinase-like domain-containing protein n=2 Tax=Pieris macdunnoughi TaxID=345717 RepID=A0A821VZB4_9NEOP|nr:unnamed protein product [Pieris macdunnoughi]